MTDKKVLSLITKEQTQKEDYQKDLLEIVDSFRKMIVDGEIIEFAISSLDVEGEIVITTCCKDLLGGVGLFEMGKHTLMMQSSYDFE
jgi:hypothetical protein|tara:strand:+ start:321 stop:581 length:261 start_codon:yes stop_codon:yes gene_type:complete